MDLNTITVADFKAQFVRDFPYLPVWVAGTYNTGEEVYYTPTRLFYTAKENGVVALPTDASKWTVTEDLVDNYVSDADIERAFAEAKVVFNQTLFTTDANIKMGFLYVTAHYLCLDIQAALAGINGGGGIGVLSGRSVGSVSETYSIPQRYLDDPLLAMYAKTNYGMKFLSLVMAKLRGNFGVVAGATLP